MIRIADIVALAKQGYKPSDIKELLSFVSSEDGAPKEDKNIQGEKTEEPETGKEQPEKEQQKPTEEPQKVVAIDEYKKKVEELEKELENLKKENTKKDVSGNASQKSDEDILNDITRSYM